MGKANETRVVTLDDEAGETGEQTIQASPAVPTEKGPEIEVRGKNFDDQLCGDKVRIEIHETESDGGKDDVFVQINGYAYSIKRGVEVVVPVEVLHVLENATMKQYSAAQGGGHSERTVKRFAYSVIEKIPAKKKGK